MLLPTRLRYLARWVRSESPTIRVPVRHLAELGHLFATTGRVGGTTQRRFELLRRLSGVDVLSVDLFDTLVQRRCLLPEDVHEIVAMASKCDGLLEGLAWPEIRERGEEIARAQSVTPDVTLDAIFAQFKVLLNPRLLSDLKESELRAETALARPTSRGQELWRAAKEAGKTIVVTTDTYLPKHSLVEILEKCGYEGWESIYASGDDRIAKFDGSTFRQLRADFPGSRILHVGDNKTSDVIVAQRSGISAMQLRRPFDSYSTVRSGLPSHVDRRRGYPRVPESRQTRLGISINAALTEDWLDRNQDAVDVVDEIGYGVLGPALVGFSQYLGREAPKNGTERLLFLAREGAILRRAYAEYHGDSAMENGYAVISTRMLGLAGLAEPQSEESLHFLTKTTTPLRVVDFISRVLPDTPEESVRAACRRAGVPWDARFTQPEAKSRLLDVFGKFADELATIGEESGPTVLGYLESLGTSRPGTAIVDVGWAGSVQSAMNRITHSVHTGYFLGLCDSAITRAVPRLYAWVDERRGGRLARDFPRLHRRCHAFEVLLANVTSGTANSVMRASDGETGPIFAIDYLPSEFSEADREKIEGLQGRALEFVRDYAESVEPLPPEMRQLSVEAAFGPVFEFLTSPSLVQLRALRRTHFDGTNGVRASKLGQWWLPLQLRRAPFRRR